MFEFFKKKPEPTLPKGDTAWADVSRLYTSAHFTQYNPDDLIGRKGFGIYKKMMQDEQIKACIKFKRDAITSRDYQFVLDAEEYGLSPEEADRRINLSYKYIDKMRGSWMDALNYVMAAYYNGFSMTEMLFNQIEFEGSTWWSLDVMRAKPFDTFYFHQDEFGNLEKIEQKAAGKSQDIDPSKFIHFVVNPDYDCYYGSSELRECYRAWFSKDMIIKFRNMWLERHAGGFRWLQANEKNSISPNSVEYTKLQNMLMNVQTTTSAIVPSGYSMNSDYPANVAGFKEAIDDYDMCIARSLLVPALLGISPQGNTGSFSQSITQMEAFLWTLDADTSRLEDTLNEQLFRQLGEINFGDDAWPRFKFKPASMNKKMELVKTWSTLVTSGAVVPSESDEDHIRDLMDMPAKPEMEEEMAPAVSLNSNQVTSLVDIVGRAGRKEISTESAVQILISVFPMTEEQARSIVGEAPEKPVIPAMIPGNEQQSTDNNQPPDDKKPIDGEQEMIDGAAPIDKETVMGKGSLKVAAFEAASSRVDFIVIGSTSEAAVDDNSLRVGMALDAVVKDLIAKGRSGGDVGTDVSLNIAALKPDPKLQTKLNKALYGTLVEGQMIGIRHAENEIDKAKKTAFSRKVDRKRINMIAEDYFRTSAFKITGNLTDEATKMIEQEILNGSKYGYTWDQIEQNIYAVFAKKGMMSPEEAKSMLGEALGVDVPDARLRTIVRTSTFDAINNARYSYFTDPGMDNFVIGFEYSAILDDRTTEYCFIDETDVVSLGSLQNVFRSQYEGEIITITTASGKKITGTPNHPILTLHGFLPLGELDPSKHVVYSVTDEAIEIFSSQNIGMPSSIGEVFDALNKPTVANVIRKRASPIDFYGDGVGMNGEINIISTKRELGNNIVPVSDERVINKQLASIGGDEAFPTASGIHSHFISLPKVVESAQFAASSTENLIEPAATSASTHSIDNLTRSNAGIKEINSNTAIGNDVAIMLAALQEWHDASFFEQVGNGSCGDSVISTDLSGTCPSFIFGDDVVSVTREFRNCHVYTLGCDLGYYIAGGIIVKNCRHMDEDDAGNHSVEWWDAHRDMAPPAHYNCRSILVPVTQIDADSWEEGPEPSMEPKGFSRCNHDHT